MLSSQSIRYVSLRWALVLVFLAAFSIPLRAASHAEDLFQQALLKESGERNLEAAIDLYQQVLAEPGADHLLTLEARIRMGNCYERLGKTKEAEEIYEQIVKESETPQSEFALEAQASLHRLQAQDRRVHSDTSTIKPETMVVAVREYKETGASISLGAALLGSAGTPLEKMDLALRYRLSRPARSQKIFLELHAIAPVGGTSLQNQSKAADSQTTDTANLDFNYQTSLSLISELPHGLQRNAIPEIGAGLAVTDAALTVSTRYTGTLYPAEATTTVDKRTVSPYITAGVHLFPDRMVSYLISGSYTAVPFPASAQVAAPPHLASFDVTSGLWAFSANVQVKIGWPQLVLKPKP